MISEEVRIAPCPECNGQHVYLVEAGTVARVSMPSAAVCQSPRPVHVEVEFACPHTGGEFTRTVELCSPSGMAITWTEATALPDRK